MTAKRVRRRLARFVGRGRLLERAARAARPWRAAEGARGCGRRPFPTFPPSTLRSASGLTVCPDGSPKVIEMRDCTGSGDVDTSTVRKADKDGTIESADGARRLALNPAWSNDAGDWHVGQKRLFDLAPGGLKARLKEDRARVFDAAHATASVAAADALARVRADKATTKLAIAEAEAAVAALEGERKAFAELDPGPMVEVVCWNDGTDKGADDGWRVALDTTEMGPGGTALAGFAPMTHYRVAQQWAAFDARSAFNFGVNVWNGGSIVELVADAGPHGSHVAGIAAAYHPDAPELNGVAPGAKIVSLKIGDSRLGSMETGVGVARAVAAAVELGVDVINMSYGEACFSPDAGRFAALAEEAVHRHGILFISSAGNAGPALGTVGAPGGTASAIMSIGAYVSPALAAAGHSLRTEVAAGADQSYTWSSRGPTADGAVGVSVCAPGGAIAPVPQWTRQARQLMNGTSMASPSAAGVAALVLSAAKASAVEAAAAGGGALAAPTPARVRRALENTALPVGTGADAALTYGRGLCQADAAADALLKEMAAPDARADARYEVSVRRADGGPAGRGLLLREPADTAGREAVAASVTITPRMHDDADAVGGLLDIEHRLELTPSAPWITCPRSLLLPAGGRSFEMAVDVSALPPGSGLHYGEIAAVDAAARWRGPLAIVPITVIRPMAAPAGGDVELDPALPLAPGAEARFFVEAPAGATWATLTVAAPAGAAPPRGLMLRLTAHAPHARHTDTEARTYVGVGPADDGRLTVAVAGGCTLEVTIAQFWSSAGKGPVAARLSFHGLPAAPAAVALAGDAARVTVAAPLRAERLAPCAQVTRVRRLLRPEARGVPVPLPGPRDALPSRSGTTAGHGLLLEYATELTEAGTYEACIPLASGLVYDSSVDARMVMAFDAHKKLLGISDIYPAKLKLPKGRVVFRAWLRHDDPAGVLAGLAATPLQVDRLLDAPVAVPIYASHADALLGTAAAGVEGGENGGGGGGGGNSGGPASAAAPPSTVKDRTLHRGERVALFVGPLPDAKLPKDAAPGMLLVGGVRLGKAPARDGGGDAPGALPLTILVPPKAPPKPEPKEEEVEEEEGKPKPTAGEKRDAAVREALVCFLGGLSPGDDEAAAVEADALFADALAAHPGHLPLLAARVKALDALTGAPRTARLDAILAAASAVEAAVDIPALYAAAARALPDESPGAAARAKETKAERAALVDALVARARARRAQADEADALATAGDDAEAATAALRAWLKEDDPRAARLYAATETAAGRPARAAALLAAAAAAPDAPGGTAAAKADAAARAAALESLGWCAAAAAARNRARDAFPPAYPLF